MYREPRRSPYFPREDVPFGLWQINDQPPVQSHDHDFLELAIVESGRGLHDFEGYVLPIEFGDLFIIPPGYRHAWVETIKLNVINVMLTDMNALPHLDALRLHPGFDPLFGHRPDLENQQKGRCRLRLDISQLKEVLRIIQRLRNALNNPDEVPSEVVMVQVAYFLAVLCDAYVEAPSRNRQVSLRVSHVIRYMEDHYAEPITCTELAQSMHVSQATFYRLFREATGSTPIQYVNQLRLTHACKLLKNTDKTIADIAFTVGFEDSNYFSRLFRKHHSVSPQKYRQGGA